MLASAQEVAAHQDASAFLSAAQSGAVTRHVVTSVRNSTVMFSPPLSTATAQVSDVVVVVVPPSAAFVGSPNGATSLIGEAGARLVSVDAVRALVAWWRAVEALAYALVCVCVCVAVWLYRHHSR